MFIFVKRCLVYILVPVGIVLLFAPLNTYRREFVKQHYVYLTAEYADSEASVNSNMVVLTREGLDPFPRLREIMDEHAVWFDGRRSVYHDLAVRTSQSVWRREPADIGVDEWKSFTGSLLNSRAEQVSFRYQGLLFHGQVRYDEAYVSHEIPGLDTGRRIAGALFLLAGVLLLTRLYRAKKGIQVARPGVIVLWDLIVIVFCGFFIHAVVEFGFVKYLGTEPFWDNDFHLMGTFFVLVSVPLLSLYISATATQSLTITQEGIASNGLFKRKFLPWSDLQAVSAPNIYSAKPIGQVVVPRQVTRVLRLEGENEGITIMEPPLKSTKRHISDELVDKAPSKWKQLIREAAEGW